MKRILVKWGIMFLVVGMVLACSVEAKASEGESGNENVNIGDGSDVGDGSGDIIVDDEIVEDVEEITIGDKKVVISKKKEKGAPYLEWEWSYVKI